MKKIFPKKLKKGDEVRVIAPSRSLSLIGSETREIADSRFSDLKLKLTFGAHVDESDGFVSTKIESRVKDLHDAFVDKKVKAIITVIGGFNSNQLLDEIDWNIIKSNPKIFCGFSDITALNNAIYAKTGLVTYSGPHYSTFGQKFHFNYTLDYFTKCLFANEPFEIVPSKNWSDDEWYLDQDKRKLLANKGYWIINPGSASGTVLGANLCTFNLLQGTNYFPSLKNSVLFIEDDYESVPHTFDRDLQSLIHQPNFGEVKGIIIGRFQKKSKMTKELLTKIIKTKEKLKTLPVIANIDFGHADPKITFPIGGNVELNIEGNNQLIKITKH